MKEIKATKSFKKDLKRYVNQPEKLRELYDFVNKYLRKGNPIPAKYRVHMLRGGYAGHMECHIEDEAMNAVKLVRLGSHSELFG